MHHMSRFRSSEYYAEAARTSKLSKYCMKGRGQDRVHILYPGVGISYLAAANMLGMNGVLTLLGQRGDKQIHLV